jgi:hypothetical protein
MYESGDLSGKAMKECIAKAAPKFQVVGSE